MQLNFHWQYLRNDECVGGGMCAQAMPHKYCTFFIIIQLFRSFKNSLKWGGKESAVPQHVNQILFFFFQWVLICQMIKEHLFQGNVGRRLRFSLSLTYINFGFLKRFYSFLSATLYHFKIDRYCIIKLQGYSFYAYRCKGHYKSGILLIVD